MTVQLPIEVSADGKRNAFIHSCDPLKQRRNYAVCLHLCSERKKGRLGITYSDCSSLIGKKICPALAMRKAETDAGHAIYFEERNKVMPGFLDMAKEFVGNVVAITSRKPKSAPAKAKPADLLSSIDTGGYADAINAAIAAPKPAEVPKVEVPKVEQRQGESLLEMARRLMSK